MTRSPNLFTVIINALFVAFLALGALHCGGTEDDETAAEQQDNLSASGPWGSCTLVRDGIKVPAYYDPATGCCCYNGDCERQGTQATASSYNNYYAR